VGRFVYLFCYLFICLFLRRSVTVRSCSSSVSIVSDYRLNDRGLIPGRAKVFLL
jgi:hypothetical protein